MVLQRHIYSTAMHVLLFLISFRLVVQRKVARKSDTANQYITHDAVENPVRAVQATGRTHSLPHAFHRQLTRMCFRALAREAEAAAPTQWRRRGRR